MKVICLLFTFLLCSCSYRASEKAVNWHKGEGAEKLAETSKSISTADWQVDSRVEFAGFKIEQKSQVLKGSEVEDTYSKSSEEIDSKSLFNLSAQFQKKGILPLIFVPEDSSKARDEFLKKYPQYSSEELESFKSVFGSSDNQLELLWKGVLFQNNQLWEILLTKELKILSLKRIGSHFDVQAKIFPKGAKHSELTLVTLLEIMDQERLSSPRVVVTSEVPGSALNTQETLNFSPQDLNFDQVQAYYNLDASLRWFEEKFGYKPYQKIQAVVHLSYPDKTNAAFYYNGKIRIGTGDGVTYSHLAQDPSVVIHESAHTVIEAVARLPFEGEGGSLNEGFADFFTAVQLENPLMGEQSYLKGPYKRNLNTVIKLGEKTGGLYHDSQILSGLLWQFYQQIGEKNSLKIASRLLVEMNPLTDFAALQALLPKVVYDLLEPVDLRKALKILEERGF
jgi:hypothetical protein